MCAGSMVRPQGVFPSITVGLGKKSEPPPKQRGSHREFHFGACWLLLMGKAALSKHLSHLPPHLLRHSPLQLSELDVCEQCRCESYPSPLSLRMFAQMEALFWLWQRPKAGRRKRLHPDGCHFPCAGLLFAASCSLRDAPHGFRYGRLCC